MFLTDQYILNYLGSDNDKMTLTLVTEPSLPATIIGSRGKKMCLLGF